MKRISIFKTIISVSSYFYKSREPDGIHLTNKIKHALSVKNLSQNEIDIIKEEFSKVFESPELNFYNDKGEVINICSETLQVRKVFYLHGKDGTPLSKNGKINILSICCAIFMAFSELIIGNCPYNLGEIPPSLTVIENIIRKLPSTQKTNTDGYFVNVGYDKEVATILTPAKDTGKVAITDRKVLLDILNIAEKSKYKYIFLDINFERGINTKWDKLLFEKIKKMPRLSYATHVDNSVEYNLINDNYGNPKYAYNDYKASFVNSGFSKYEYVQDKGPSAALKMYEEINHKKLSSCGSFLFNDGSLLLNSPIIPIRESLIRAEQSNLEKSIPVNLFDWPALMGFDEEELIKDFENKIIIVGDFNKDVHDTYMGEQAGPFITYLAYKYLSEGKNKVPIILYLFLIVLFFFIIKSKLSNRAPTLNYKFLFRILWIKRLIKYLRICLNFVKHTFILWIKRLLEIKYLHICLNFVKHTFILWIKRLLEIKYLRICLNFVKHTFILSVICYIVYIFWGDVYNVLIPSIVISVVDNYKNIKYQ